MKRLIAAVTTLMGLGASPASANNSVLEYDQMVILDAEDLAETGIKDAYEKLNPILKSHITEPAEIVEKIDNDLPSYSVSCSGVAYDIYSPTLPNSQGESWGMATYALFIIINNQLKGSNVKFYAINGGNELGGMFLTERQVTAAKNSLKKKTDWPYLPTLEPPWYGLHH
jgi:hypothetical protein